MATTASPMASQLKSSLASSLERRLVISGAPFRISPNKRSFTVKAAQADKLETYSSQMLGYIYAGNGTTRSKANWKFKRCINNLECSKLGLDIWINSLFWQGKPGWES
ncbi:hypothetical protein OIU77_012749 [Salix suchowensis]|uniref:Uncharacterized protein n=1 Tax=Salix suchowensis TaxID=1278906 RepID=A0ABQ9A5J3_9ROSI|nr:hypothetical protein OIU77_012749 [Salix suchowensis]